MLTVLVCGGRGYGDSSKVHYTLDVIHSAQSIDELIQGGAKGADRLAGMWADRHPSVMHRIYKADWDRYGKAAGAIRNQRMLTEGKPDLVVAFPGGQGTAHMVRIAKKAGVPVTEVT